MTESADRPIVETRFRVRFYETDQMGVVHHAAYITWFEEGRSAFTRAIGYPYAQMEADGVALAVAEVSARYHQAAAYDDEVIVAARLDALQSRGMTFSYEIRRARDDALLVTGTTRHISVDHHIAASRRNQTRRSLRGASFATKQSPMRRRLLRTNRSQ
jgi:acyl-CoA thioester hydrolase